MKLKVYNVSDKYNANVYPPKVNLFDMEFNTIDDLYSYANKLSGLNYGHTDLKLTQIIVDDGKYDTMYPAIEIQDMKKPVEKLTGAEFNLLDDLKSTLERYSELKMKYEFDDVSAKTNKFISAIDNFIEKHK